MAHYAYLNNKNIVTGVIRGPDENNFPPGFSSWEEYFSSKGKGRVLRTSYNTRGGIHYDAETGEPSGDQSKAFRKNYAGPGYKYDSELDAFIPSQPFDSWVLNQGTCLWEAPIPFPDDGNNYFWSEEKNNWVIQDN